MPDALALSWIAIGLAEYALGGTLLGFLAARAAANPGEVASIP
jgi:hypothetical protein